MKFNINGKDVDLFINGEKIDKMIKKAKLSDKQLDPNKIVRKAKEKLEEE